MNPRRIEQLDRARKLGATISVALFHERGEGPLVIEIDRLRHSDFDTYRTCIIRVMSWRKLGEGITVSVTAPSEKCLTEELIAKKVDTALDRFDAAARDAC